MITAPFLFLSCRSDAGDSFLGSIDERSAFAIRYLHLSWGVLASRGAQEREMASFVSWWTFGDAAGKNRAGDVGAADTTRGSKIGLYIRHFRTGDWWQIPDRTTD